MSKVEQIEQQVRALSSGELASFREWFLKFDWEAWDRELADERIGIREQREQGLQRPGAADHAFADGTAASGAGGANAATASGSWSADRR